MQQLLTYGPAVEEVVIHTSASPSTTYWKLQSHCLETQLFPEDHTAHNIRGFFDNMLQEWGINKERLVSVTTDNATNMKKAFESDTTFPGQWFGCFGHNLNLAISKALKIRGWTQLSELSTFGAGIFKKLEEKKSLEINKRP